MNLCGHIFIESFGHRVGFGGIVWAGVGFGGIVGSGVAAGLYHVLPSFE